ncbi:transmembrane protein 127 [Denticeps clupeoides]|uniref:transmembrane protein 127 n=1 Tax=Denticeps clupeoides TaxID=299321 RepID=UPI0010A33904|nr:transmembrane protein 127-like [Denticeps clupeoides]XP_028829975.1 transmembrane protein 127-like [Denticeps clupeoides]
MTLGLTPAAACQCFTLVALCTSIADPNWIHVQNTSGLDGKQLIYGVAFTLHAAQNLTDTAPLGGLNGTGMWLLYALAALCYGSVLFSSTSFLLDFLGVGLTHARLIEALHVFTAVLCVAVLGVCGACVYVISRNLQQGRLGNLTRSGLHPYAGESLYIQVLGLIFSCMAAAFSISSQTETSRSRHYVPVDSRDTEPLLARAGREELDGQVFPETGS